jgi:hypothetical protein
MISICALGWNLKRFSGTSTGDDNVVETDVETGDPGGARTPNPQFRRLMLYPVELRGREKC